MPDTPKSRLALLSLLRLVEEIDARFLGPEWGIDPASVPEGIHALMHLLQGGLYTHYEDDPAHPRFRRIVSPTRKFTGDNADAIYYDTAIDPSRAYRVRGETAGAVYVSLTIESGAQEGRFGSRTAGVINDTGFDVAADGRFEIFFGGPPRPRNWIALPADAARITTRHYFEEERAAAANPDKRIRLDVELLGDPVAPPAPPNDAGVAAGIERVVNFVRSRTLDMGPPGSREQPAFVSTTPNQFPPPVKPGDFALAAADAAYSMAPFVLGPDEALVLSGRWPRCRCANVSLWNRHMQTFDFAHRQVSLNRRQTRCDADGRFRMVIAHRDPGVPNWLDTEGRAFGIVFWRFMLPEGDIETPSATVVPFADVARP
jgi:hypothetical protein